MNARSYPRILPIAFNLLVVFLLLIGLAAIPTPALAGVTIRYVQPSPVGSGDCSTWANACNLQTALGASISGDQVWVLEGTYKPTDGTDRTISFQLANGVEVYGGFPGGATEFDQRDPELYPSILSGDIGTPGDRTDNSHHVVVNSGTVSTTVLDGFTITGGQANGSGSNDSGGGIYSIGDLTVTNSSFIGNNSSSYGGAVYSSDSNTLIINNSTFSNNSVVAPIANPSRAEGGAIYNQGTMNVTNSTFSNNSVTASGDEVYAYGGAISNRSTGTATITNSTFSGNQARANLTNIPALSATGGAIDSDGTLNISNSTFFENRSYGGLYGGGGAITATTGTVINSTFSENGFGEPATTYAAAQGASILGTITLKNTIVASAEYDFNCSWNVTADSYNLNTDDSCGSATTRTTAQIGLGALANHGGHTETIALLPGSDAIDAGDDASCPSGDQRGVTRPQGAHCDIGAFEVIPATVSLSVTSLNFGNVVVGTTSAVKTVTIANTGELDLHIGTLGITGDFGLSNNTCSNETVTPGNDCTFDVRFAPLTTGTQTGTVALVSDAASSPDEVALTGNGTSAQYYTLRYRSNGANDGMVRESTETSGVGGYINAVNKLIAVGDDSLKRQYVGILDFDTSNLPNNAVITSASLRIKAMIISNGVYAKLGNLTADITKPYFGTFPSLQTADFGFAATANAGTFTKASGINQWITMRMKAGSLFAVNPLGHTQFRIRFTRGDSNDLIKHQIGFLSGNYGVVTDRPVLIITYYIP